MSCAQLDRAFDVCRDIVGILPVDPDSSRERFGVGIAAVDPESCRDSCGPLTDLPPVVNCRDNGDPITDAIVPIVPVPALYMPNPFGMVPVDSGDGHQESKVPTPCVRAGEGQ